MNPKKHLPFVLSAFQKNSDTNKTVEITFGKWPSRDYAIKLLLEIEPSKLCRIHYGVIGPALYYDYLYSLAKICPLTSTHALNSWHKEQIRTMGALDKLTTSRLDDVKTFIAQTIEHSQS